MKFFYATLILAALLSLTSCVSIGRESFIRNPEYSPNKTIKVVNVNTNDLILGRIEHHLIENGLPVISDNYLRGALPTGLSTTVHSPDTTFTVPQFHSVSLQLFDDQPADYILRYEYKSADAYNYQAFSYFNARLVNTRTGSFDASFIFSQGHGLERRSVDQVLSMFARELAGR
ncbi:MAG: hypothetical protein H6557_08925 [Lewinellaceae bacterium]|nr:hypothetical protein [Phaeodactylibacter sp.]MCB9036727.1 hypothetical protein [Lewinellaceae bacterium]